MSDLDQNRESVPGLTPLVGATSDKLQRLLLSAFVRQQEQVRRHIDHTGRLAAVLSIQQEITSREPDLEEVLSLVSNRAISLLGATGSAIALQRNGVMVCRASGGATGPALGAHLSADFGLSGECLRTGLPILCNDVDKDSRVDTAAAQALGIRSLIVAPVFHHRTTVGVFEVFSCEAEFFDKEDAHVVELLGGMITTAISYSSEFEAKQTLESERSAMLQVIERITPTITKMLEQQSAAGHEAAAIHEDFHDALAQHYNLLDDELPHVSDEVGAETTYSDHVSLGDEGANAVDTSQGNGRGHAAGFAEAETASNGTDKQEEEFATFPPKVSATDREAKAVDSAIQILLSHQHVLKPEPPDGTDGSSENEIAGVSLFTPVPRPIATASATPVPAPAPAGDFDWPEPEAPPLPAGNEVPDPFAGPVAEENVETSALSDWSPPALLQTRPRVPASTAPDLPGELMPSRPSTTEFFSLNSDVPPIPPAGAVKASKAVGAPTAPLGRSRGGIALSLRLRNVMEYVVPAVLTGLLIVIGLQWLTNNQHMPSLLGSKGLKAPPPSMFTSGRTAPVEVSLLKIPAPSGLSRSGKELSNRVSAIVGYDRTAADDWSESAKKLGKQITDKLPNLPSTAPDGGSQNNQSALSSLERMLPSNGVANAKTPKILESSGDSSGPVAQVYLPVEVVDDYILVRVQPMYPQAARQNNISGTVVIKTVIGKDGSVRETDPVAGNKFLAEAAMAAVSQWRYKPFVLNGKPIEVATDIRILFTHKTNQKPSR
jgi:TonB family protein